MSMQDTIADFLTQIRNAQAADKKNVSMPSSKIRVAIAKVLQEEGYINGVAVDESDKATLTIELKYFEGKGVIDKIKRVSRPGLRVYRGAKAFPRVLNGLGIAIVSTPQGVMTADAAKKAGVGGEVLCFVE